MNATRRLLFLLFFLALTAFAHAEPPPVWIGLDAEISHKTSTSDEAIRQGILIAMDEINRAGGVLGGRKLALLEKDNHSVPARGVQNLRELAAQQDLVAVFCGKFSPVVLEALPTVHELGLPLLDPWAAADEIIDNGYRPNFVFRLGLRDSWALGALLDHAGRRGLKRVGMLAPNGAWGRGNYQAARKLARSGRPALAAVAWYNWSDSSLLEPYRRLKEAGAQAVLFVGNEMEGALLVRTLGELPAAERLPVLSHWGVTGGDLPKLAGPALAGLDFSVVQTFSFEAGRKAKVQRIAEKAAKELGVDDPARIPSVVGLAHAYDLTHLLARAVQAAGSTDRAAIRNALERLGPFDGLVRSYRTPFTPSRHEALGPDQVFIARYRPDGTLVTVPR